MWFIVAGIAALIAAAKSKTVTVNASVTPQTVNAMGVSGSSILASSGFSEVEKTLVAANPDSGVIVTGEFSAPAPSTTLASWSSNDEMAALAAWQASQGPQE